MTRALAHPRLKCSPEVAILLGAKPRRIGQGWPIGTILIGATDGTFWLLPIDLDAWRSE